jgi:hypothetical protein
MDIPKGEIIEARTGDEDALREILENLKDDFSGYVEVVGKDNSLGQILFFDGRPRLALFEGDSRLEGRDAVAVMIESSKDYDTEIKVHRYPMVALLLDRFPEAEVNEEALGMPKKIPKVVEGSAESDEMLFNRREELTSVLSSEPVQKPQKIPVPEKKVEAIETMESDEIEELRKGLLKRLNLENFYKKKEA